MSKLIEVDNNSGQAAGTVQGNQIQNNNYLFTQNRKIIEFKYDKNEELKNKEEIIISLLSLDIHNLDFVITDLDNVYDKSWLNDCLFSLKNQILKKLNSHKDEQYVREFLQSIRYIGGILNNDKKEIIDLVGIGFMLNFDCFLIVKKIKNGSMPDLNSLSLSWEFYNLNKEFDFVKVFGYEFDKKFTTLSDLISLYNKNIKSNDICNIDIEGDILIRIINSTEEDLQLQIYNYMLSASLIKEKPYLIEFIQKELSRD